MNDQILVTIQITYPKDTGVPLDHIRLLANLMEWNDLKDAQSISISVQPHSSEEDFE